MAAWLEVEKSYCVVWADLRADILLLLIITSQRPEISLIEPPVLWLN